MRGVNTLGDKTLDDGSYPGPANSGVRLNFLISGLLLMMTEFQQQPCAGRARLIAQRLVVLSEHGSADPTQRDLARSLAEHWLMVVGDGGVEQPRVLN
ncbi:MAG: hypothetical protein ACRBC3_01505 [Burkholderiaceae bacterium]